MQNPNLSVRISKFVAIESGTYNQTYHRPYESHVTGDLHREILGRLDPSLPYSTSVFSDIAVDFIRPSSVPSGEVKISGGWAARRLRWILELEWLTSFGTREVQVITGYSDPMDLSYNGRIDPRASLYVNNSFMFRIQTENTPQGPITRLVPSGGGQVMIDNNYAGMYTSDNKHLARPSDVIIANALSPYVHGEFSQTGMSFNSGSAVTNDAKLSTRNNANPASYMNRLMEASRKAMMSNMDIGQSVDDLTLAMRSNASDTSTRNDKFLSMLRNLNSSTVYSNVFTHDQLRLIDPNVDNVTRVIALDAYRRSISNSTIPIPVHDAGQTQHWQGTDHHTQIATALANAIPGIMADNALSSISVQFTNRDGLMGAVNSASAFKSSVSRVNSFITNLDMTYFIQNFIDRVSSELLVGLSHNHSFLFEVTIHSDMLGDTRLEININGERIDYCLPTFCDALYSPVVQNSQEGIINIASSFGRLMDDSYEGKSLSYRDPFIDDLVVDDDLGQVLDSI